MKYTLPTERKYTLAMELGASAGAFEEVLLLVMAAAVTEDPYDDTDLTEMIENCEGALKEAYQEAINLIRSIEPMMVECDDTGIPLSK